jgi:hypothetical protein
MPGRYVLDATLSVPVSATANDPEQSRVEWPSMARLEGVYVRWPGSGVGVRIRRASGERLFPRRGAAFARVPASIERTVPVVDLLEEGDELVVECTNSTNDAQTVVAWPNLRRSGIMPQGAGIDR